MRKLWWIRRQQARFPEQPRELRHEMVSGETHWYLGRRHLLRIAETTKRTGIFPAGRYLELRCRRGASPTKRAEIMDAWYRRQRKALLPLFIATCQPRFEVEVADWRVRRMKTKWASCNPKTRRLWFNTELAKKPRAAIEYLVVHELMHLVHRRHDARFIELMSRQLQKWQSIRRELGQLPLTRDWWPED